MSLVLPKIRHCVIVLHSQSSATHGMGPVRHFAKHRKNWHKVNFVENGVVICGPKRSIHPSDLFIR